jgi:predicted Zn-dependent protease
VRREELEDLAQRALGHAGGEAQATVTRERSLLSRFARSTPTQATEVDALAVSVTCVRDGHPASAATTRVDEEGLRDVAARAGAAADALASSGPGAYPGLPSPEPPRPHDGWDEATAALDPRPAGAALGAAFAVAGDHGAEAFGIWTAGAVETALASSTGVHAFDGVTDAYMKVICRDPNGRSGFAAATGTAAAQLDATELAGTAAGKLTGGEPVELEPGEYPVVFEPHAVGLLLEFLGMLAFNGLAHAEGRGALVGRLGERVVAPSVNLSDSPRYRETIPRSIDAEGVPKAPLPLIQDGVAHRVVHDTASAAVAGDGARSTGHALTPGGDPNGPEPFNLVLVGGGAADEAELAAPVERGLYVTRLWYVNVVDPKRTLLTGMTRDGTFLIEDGQVARPVRDVRFTDEVLRILAATEALSARPRLVTEGEFYGGRFAYGTVCPAPGGARRRRASAARSPRPRARCTRRGAAAGSRWRTAGGRPGSCRSARRPRTSARRAPCRARRGWR